MSVCRHCRMAKANRPRRLCRDCYYTTGVRQLYPAAAATKFARRGVHDFYGRCELASFPTQALPGTSEKIAVLQIRANLGQELWHPDDAAIDRRFLPLRVG